MRIPQADCLSRRLAVEVRAWTDLLSAGFGGGGGHGECRQRVLLDGLEGGRWWQLLLGGGCRLQGCLLVDLVVLSGGVVCDRVFATGRWSGWLWSDQSAERGAPSRSLRCLTAVATAAFRSGSGGRCSLVQDDSVCGVKADCGILLSLT